MRPTIRLLVSTCLTLAMAMVCYSAEWRRHCPLHSTRIDVEKIFGSNVRGCKTLWCIYNLERENVWIQYASGPPCGNDAADFWQVPRDTVIQLTVNFKEEPLLSDLRIDLRAYVRTEDTHLPGWIYYTDAAEGIVVAGGLRTVSSVTYLPEEKDKNLRCPKNRAEHALEADSPVGGLYP